MDRKGFTLIELMVVMAIIALLASILLPAIQNHTVRARNTSRMGNMASLQSAISQFKIDNAQYPNNGDTWWGECDYGNHPHEGSNGYVPNLAPDYIRRLPTDPICGENNPTLGDNCDGYLYRSTGLNYKLLSHRCPEDPGSHYGDESFKYYDPNRPTWAWATYSGGARNW